MLNKIKSSIKKLRPTYTVYYVVVDEEGEVIKEQSMTLSATEKDRVVETLASYELFQDLELKFDVVEE